MSKPDTMPKRDLDVVIAYLDTGLTLSSYTPRGERRLRRGDVTRERASDGAVRTTHLTADLRGYVWLTREAIKRLASVARTNWPNRAALLSDVEARIQSAEGRG